MYKWYNIRPFSMLIVGSVQILNRIFQNSDIPNIKFHCFTVHFNSLNFTHQLMHFYM